jgi:DNA-binding NarL/FixJ family response regulator
MHMIKVVIVDDHAFVRSALGDLLAAFEDIRVVAECSDGCHVVETVARTDPDVVLMDLVMPVMSGLEATRALRDASPGIRVIVLTGSVTTVAAREARALGVCGVLLKCEDGGDVLPGHIRAVAAGGTAWNVATAKQAAPS